jgi:hypothetical protein
LGLKLIAKQTKYTLIGSLFVVPLALAAIYGIYQLGLWNPLGLFPNAPPPVKMGESFAIGMLTMIVSIVYAGAAGLGLTIVLLPLSLLSRVVGTQIVKIATGKIIKTKEVDPKAGQLSHPDLVATTLERPRPPPPAPLKRK